ncbi:type II toxin-antitoxin system HicA family toxin [Novosphingopyxis sp.]|uniref:type II toxin-antitoxin system HicA family toxin n=1 Tax=Novosphingopyxis sp. TaxID=2709690 RepID=UPI003B59D94B
MPRLPLLSGADIVRALERLGFEQKRQRGSHVVMRRETNGCVVPMHKEIKTGTLAGIIRQAGLSNDEFLDALKK